MDSQRTPSDFEVVRDAALVVDGRVAFFGMACVGTVTEAGALDWGVSFATTRGGGRVELSTGTMGVCAGAVTAAAVGGAVVTGIAAAGVVAAGVVAAGVVIAIADLEGPESGRTCPPGTTGPPVVNSR
jgi:hypothetical protein